MAVQDTRCLHEDCTLKSRYCKNPEHPKQIVGGLGPRLINKGLQIQPTLAAALDDKRAELKARVSDVDRLRRDKAEIEEQLAKARQELEATKTSQAAELEKATAPSTKKKD
jgi:hypothetical protein